MSSVVLQAFQSKNEEVSIIENFKNPEPFQHYFNRSIFIAHTGNRYSDAKQIQLCLENAGYDSFLDTHSFFLGQRLDSLFDSIIPNLGHLAIVLLDTALFQQDRKEWVEREIISFIKKSVKNKLHIILMGQSHLLHSFNNVFGSFPHHKEQNPIYCNNTIDLYAALLKTIEKLQIPKTIFSCDECKHKADLYFHIAYRGDGLYRCLPYTICRMKNHVISMDFQNISIDTLWKDIDISKFKGVTTEYSQIDDIYSIPKTARRYLHGISRSNFCQDVNVDSDILTILSSRSKGGNITEWVYHHTGEIFVFLNQLKSLYIADSNMRNIDEITGQITSSVNLMHFERDRIKKLDRDILVVTSSSRQTFTATLIDSFNRKCGLDAYYKLVSEVSSIDISTTCLVLVLLDKQLCSTEYQIFAELEQQIQSQDINSLNIIIPIFCEGVQSVGSQYQFLSKTVGVDFKGKGFEHESENEFLHRIVDQCLRYTTRKGLLGINFFSTRNLFCSGYHCKQRPSRLKIALEAHIIPLFDGLVPKFEFQALLMCKHGCICMHSGNSENPIATIAPIQKQIDQLDAQCVIQ